eukprot:scaffold2204_cov166-Amphora_coffeaeformis.AAC.24
MAFMRLRVKERRFRPVAERIQKQKTAKLRTAKKDENNNHILVEETPPTKTELPPQHALHV